MYELQFENPNEFKKFLLEMKVDVADANLMASKGTFRVYFIKNISAASASILKQEALAKNCDLAIPKGAYRLAGNFSAILFGTLAALNDLQRSLAMQSAGDLNKLSENIRELVRDEKMLAPVMFGKIAFEWNKPVLATTFELSNFLKEKDQKFDLKKLQAEAKQFVEKGGEMIELSIVGEAELEKKDRDKYLLAAVRKLKGLKVALAVRTHNPELTEAALNSGASFLSDPEGLTDPRMLKLLLDTKVPLLLGYGGVRHAEGSALLRVHNFFAEKVALLRAQEFEQIMLCLPADMQIEQELGAFRSLKCPLMITSASKRDLAAKFRDLQYLENGANLLRVAKTKEGLEIFEAYKQLQDGR
ncbi:MAG: dihydropteroate synthase [Candidatus Gracilibacteria bacterium]|nr:dihydropteroate synthase [Candidatus Gracilibacteria bacterium]